MKIQRFVNSIDWSALVVALCIFIGMKPYFMWNASYLYGWLLNIATIIILFFKSRASSNKQMTPLLFYWCGIFFFFLFCSNASVFRGMLTPVLLLIFVPFINKEFASKVYTYFASISGVILAISVVVWGLALSGTISPSDVISPVNSLKTYNYQVYPLLVIGGETTNLARFCGPFDEPGVIGTLCLMLLYITEYDLRKWYNIVFLVAGICSFSLVFNVGSLVYLFLLSLYKNRRSILVISVISVTCFYFATRDNEYFKMLAYNRLAWDSRKGTLAGEDRATDSFIQYFNKIRGSRDYFLGAPNRQCPPAFDGTWGYRNAIVMYGLFFFVGYVLFFVLLSRYYKLPSRSFVLFMVLIVMILYQRPNIFELNQVFLYSYMIISHGSLLNRRNDKKLSLYNSPL